MNCSGKATTPMRGSGDCGSIPPTIPLTFGRGYCAASIVSWERSKRSATTKNRSSGVLPRGSGVGGWSPSYAGVG
jgi:hypothetical protein